MISGSLGSHRCRRRPSRRARRAVSNSGSLPSREQSATLTTSSKLRRGIGALSSTGRATGVAETTSERVRRSEAEARAEAVARGRARAGVGHVGDRSRKGFFLAAPASRARASSRGSLTGPVPERPRDRHGRAAVPRTTRQSGGSLAALVPAAAGGQVGGGGLWSARRVRLARAATWYGTLVFQLMMMRR